MSLFKLLEPKVDAAAAWTGFAGVAADEIQQRPSMNVSTYVGRIGPGRLVMASMPVRMDWNLIPNAPEESSTLRVPTLGVANDAIAFFLERARNWLPQALNLGIVRLAFGCTLFTEHPGPREALGELAARLPALGIDVDNIGELVYHINRPRVSTAFPEVTLNRLSKWEYQKISYGPISAAGLMGMQVQQPPLSESFRCAVELDINTTANRSEVIAGNVIVALFDELVRAADEIASQGDIR